MLYRGMVQSLTSSWWASHEYPLTDRVRQEERTSWGAWIDKVFLTEREVFTPLANLSWDCKSLGGCVNSMVDWGRAHVWSVERPPLVPKGEKKLEARPRCRGGRLTSLDASFVRCFGFFQTSSKTSRSMFSSKHR